MKLATGGRRTVLDYATCLDYLANNSLPEAAKIILVMDNLNTHKQASLYQAFPPEKAQMLCERFESISGPSWGGGTGRMD
ncbi:MAG: hypothetical protein H8M99_04535 [Gloeobacteraceae cyanobacterium ES-bin-144]|nr:hypothetical protein [Verrucomicrobiales bacterium]